MPKVSHTLTDQNKRLTARPLCPEDNYLIEEFCQQYPLRTLSARMNIETFGYLSPRLKVWGTIEHSRGFEERLSGILMRFSNTMIAIDTDGGCARDFAAIIDQQEGVAGIRGTLDVTLGIQSMLTKYRSIHWETSRFMVLAGEIQSRIKTSIQVHRATIDDLDRLSKFYSQAGTMFRNRANVEDRLRSVRVFLVENPEDRSVVSCALMNVEGETAGMIGGVYTLPLERGKGYASACVEAICEDLQNSGKMPTLFYENAVAGRIYRNMGFSFAGSWAVMLLSKK